MSVGTVMPADALMDLVGALRQLGAIVSLPPDFLDSAGATASFSRVRTITNSLPFGQVVTDTEFQVLRYLPTHLTVQEIAKELYRSTDTIKTHVRHLYTKLGAHSRSEAVRTARAWGLLA